VRPRAVAALVRWPPDQRGLGSSHAPLVKAEEYRQPVTRLRRYLDDLDSYEPTVPASRRVLAALGPNTPAVDRYIAWSWVICRW
jgi:hypothetical protein